MRSLRSPVALAFLLLLVPSGCLRHRYVLIDLRSSAEVVVAPPGK